MPAMITHYLIGKRILPLSGIPAISNRDAYLLGLQGPDIFFFLRVFPWQPGEKGMPLGLALHDVRPSVLIEALRETLRDMPLEDCDVAYSYILGFLCHYAADRTLHPFVCSRQKELQKREPAFAKESGPYHYRYESALDTELLRFDAGEYVSAFDLRDVLPTKDVNRDRILAQFYRILIQKTLQKDVDEKWLLHLTEDMRHAMWCMTDRNELKGKAVRFWERCRKSGAQLSPLLRTKEIENYDYVNSEHEAWSLDEEHMSQADFYEMCEQTVAYAVKLLDGFENHATGLELTEDIDFAGCRYKEKEATSDEAHSQL